MSKNISLKSIVDFENDNINFYIPSYQRGYIHFKKLILDFKEVYIGSVNLTGSGIGMKGEDKRNFEADIQTDDPAIVEQAMNRFDDVWIGKYCKRCKRRDFCRDPIK